jgi:HD-GYP domain-containing protein (c-di-GMP phosphodiesterase class II)
MENISVDSLKAGNCFSSDLMVDSTFLLLPKSAEVTDDLIKALKQWGFDEILADGQINRGGDIGITSLDDEEPVDDKAQKEKIGESVKKAIESSKHSAVGNSDQARIELVHSVYEEYMNYIESVFTHYATHKEIDKEELSETVQELCIFIKDHRRFILRVNATIQADKRNFLIIHTMRTTVLAIAIGFQLHLPLSKMIELGVTCILHEIGMLRLPPQLYMSSRKLSVREKAQISKHTLLGYSIIKDLSFGLPIQLGVLEHHEKENGTGYPRRLTGEKISANAKVIAVACTYEAISSPRSYKDEKSTFDALLELLQNREHAYDASVIKALLYTVSLYPIGTYVYLSNRKVAEVIDTNPDNPKLPVVQLLTEREADGSFKTYQVGENNINILRILNKQEKEDIKKIISQKFSSEEKSQNAGPVTSEQATASSSPVQKPATPIQSTPVKEEPEVETLAADGTEDVDISIFG